MQLPGGGGGIHVVRKLRNVLDTKDKSGCHKVTAFSTNL